MRATSSAVHFTKAGFLAHPHPSSQTSQNVLELFEIADGLTEAQGLAPISFSEECMSSLSLFPLQSKSHDGP